MLGAVADILQHRRTEGWLVGGGVRDCQLGRHSPDLDVVVADDPAAVAAEVAQALRAPWFALSERHPAYRVMGRHGRVDVAAVKGGGILSDLAERDFTVNAMAIPLGGEGLIDPFGGLGHLRQGRLVAVSERIFAEDPLRLMRVPRFCHVLGLRPDDSLARSVRAEAPELTSAAGERVAAEMVLTLAGGRAAEAVRLWEDLGLLVVVLPEVVLLGRLAPTMALLERLEGILARPSAWFPATAEPLAERLARPVDGAVERSVALRLAGLTHQLTTREAGEAGRRLKLSGVLLSLLRTVSRHFSEERGDVARLGDAGSHGAAPAGRSAVLLLWSAAPWEPEVTILEAAAGADGDGPARSGAALGPARRLMALWGERTLHGVPRLPLDGEVLMRELGLESGPLLGRVLREARLAWEAGEVTDAAQVLALAREVPGRA
jgi:poly(A) polymerase